MWICVRKSAFHKPHSINNPYGYYYDYSYFVCTRTKQKKRNENITNSRERTYPINILGMV